MYGPTPLELSVIPLSSRLIHDIRVAVLDFVSGSLARDTCSQTVLNGPC